MRVFLAGATGVIGRRLLPMLVEAGHEVTAMTRRDGAGRGAARGGREPVVCDVFDAEGLRAAVAAARPEVVVHELTDLPPNLDPRKMEEQLRGQRPHPHARARATWSPPRSRRARAGWSRRASRSPIAPTGERPEDARTTRCGTTRPWPWSRSVEALHELEDTVTEHRGHRGARAAVRVLLRARVGVRGRTATSRARCGRRRFPVVGKGTGVFSFIHVDDAAAATVAAVERGAPGIYNVVDDEPAPMRDWLPAYAEAIGAKTPRRVPQLRSARHRWPASTRLDDGDRAARRLERAAKARARLAAALPELAAGLQGALGLGTRRRATLALPQLLHALRAIVRTGS